MAYNRQKGGGNMGCSGNCGSCGGCAKALELTREEMDILFSLAQIPFLPIARRMDDMVPVYLEEDQLPQEMYSLILQCLEQKGLISLDYSKPLAGCDLEKYKAYPVKGSMALTQRGQTVVELLELQGIAEE
jgi:hypothetical protein